jgi:threonine dehydrogenase-like Zn-dependent dehydrogenase/FMN phosphatase YigB (HAD superfamily)
MNCLVSLRILLFGVLVKLVSTRSTPVADFPAKILLIDVDNTLYNERNHGIEQQIVQNIHRFCQERLGMTVSQADELHAKYGSTVEGLRQTLWNNLPSWKREEQLRDFYDVVYGNIQKDSLLVSSRETSSSNTGYTHNSDLQEQKRQERLRQLFKVSPFPLHLASNSPLHHIADVVQRMGLCDVFDRPSLTPDSPRPNEGRTKTTEFPTKRQASTFFAPLLSSVDTKKHQLVLLDDSPAALAAASPHMKGVLINNSPGADQGVSLDTALAQEFGWLDPEYTFSDIDYLRAKNEVDFASLNREAWRHVGKELRGMIATTAAPCRLAIVDLGAGLLSMLRLVVFGHDDMPSLKDMLDAPVTMDYYAYEPNELIWTESKSVLQSLGFELVEESSLNDKKRAVLTYSHQNDETRVTVHLRCCDYRDDERSVEICPQLIVGCCFADLMDPRELPASLLKCFLSQRRQDNVSDCCVAYFPITFRGITQLLPSQPFEASSRSGRTIPSDTTVFSHYADVLKYHHGHNLDTQLLDTSMKEYGADRVFQGRSNWLIDPRQHDFLWQTMLYFFGSVAPVGLEKSGMWDFKGWISRTRENKPQIYVANLDLVYRIPFSGKWQLKSSAEALAGFSKDNRSNLYEEIQFTAPGQVTSQKKKLPKLCGEQVRIESIASLISTGTELKIFQGCFNDAALDLNIKGMDDTKMAYPLAYGYCLVGRVAECGPDVQDAEAILGKTVFAFAPHASQAIVDYSVLQLVPDDIDPYDAIFMPSVETAVSLIHEAHPRLGETVGVFGQGLIGLFVTFLLSEYGQNIISGRFGTVSTFDLMPDRLALSALVGASQALAPDRARDAGPFDVSIEVSGNPRALQSAIDCTRDGGRIIIGSWYGNAEIALCLGIDFHRSHKELKASQVSFIPQGMQMTWTKDRRFQLTWDLVRKIRPSRLLTKCLKLSNCQEAYALLSEGKEIAIAFKYS